ncbi:MAG: amino acid adenylation domain-containing protein [Gammaproteobacteria bacterium]|nr:amino acid adenylation domain-containing protein [Gammaproteobacteria bacterium]MDH5801633.1 amino acid adenylation domain-containing protein [Gammaproteobacteria bacterium]
MNMAISLMSVLQRCQQSGVALSYDGDSLKVEAPKGALSQDLKQALVTHKTDLLNWLKESDEPQSVAQETCSADSENLFEPFAMSDLQRGFFMAEDPFMEFHVRPHYYIEKNIDNLDVNRYRAAWHKALARHSKEIVIVRDDGNLQLVKDPQPMPCRVNDLSNFTAAEVNRALVQTRKEMMRAELPLKQWPWLDLRISVWNEAGRSKARIHYNHNNFFSDGGGTTKLLQEVDQYYSDPDIEKPPLRISIRDALLHLEKMALSETGQKDKAYWESRLPTLPGPPALPVLGNVDRRRRSELHRREFFMDAQRWAQFKESARRNGLTPTGAISGAYAEVIAAWSNQSHFVISNMVTRRLNMHPDIWEVLGNFASLYPLEIDLSQGDNFAARALNIQQQVMKDGQHLHWGGMQVMQALNQNKGGFGQAPIPFVIGSGLFMKGFERSDFSCLETCQVMLDHQFWELKDGSYYYVWDLLEEYFPPGMIDDMSAAYLNLIHQLAENPELWTTSHFELLPLRQQSVREKRNRDAAKVCAGLERLEQFLPAVCQTYPKKKIVQSPQGCLTYAELLQHSTNLAAVLAKHGIKTQDVVAVICDRGPQLLAAVYGTLMAGGAYVPVDPALPQDRRDTILENSKARVVLVQDRYKDLQLPPGVESINIETTETGICQAPAHTSSFDLAYVIYTSGSTGRPKGVMIEHNGAINTIEDINTRFSVNSADTVFGVSSFGFDLSVYDLFGTVAAGATLVYPDESNTLNPSHWLDLMLQHHVTIWNSAPALATLLADAAEYRNVKLPHLRLVLLSGDWIPLDLPQRLKTIAPGAKVVSLGGATEASIWSILYEIDEVDSQWSSIPYGYPMKNQSWYVLDQWGRPAPEWTPGELYIAGKGLARGYCNDEEKTQAAFVNHPLNGERLYRTGDMGRYVPGALIEFLGRNDNQVKIQGYRIELGEIETVLSNHTCVSGAVVVVDKQTGSSDRLCAFVQLEPGKEFSEPELKRHIQAKLPQYMIPSSIQTIEQWPLSSNGKVDRKALVAGIQTDSNIRSNPSLEQEVPATAMETTLLKIWQRVLPGRVSGVTEDFFALGGQSFEAIQIVGQIRENTGVSLSLGDIWQARTIRELACLIENAGQQQQSRIVVPIDLTGEGNPMFLVHPAGGQVLCYRQLGGGLSRPVYAFQAPGMDGVNQPLSDIRAMARIYVEQLVRIQETGPVLLGGWSSGGLIAYEMAVQLLALGREVEGIAVIDSPAPLNHDPVSDKCMVEWFLTDLDLASAFYQAYDKVELGCETEEQLLQSAFKIMQQQNIELASDPVQLRRIYGVFKGIVNGSRNYSATPVNCSMLVLRAAQGCVKEFAHHPCADDVTWGWSNLSGGRIEGASVEATHYTILSQRNTHSVLTVVERWLQSLEKPVPLEENLGSAM